MDAVTLLKKHINVDKILEHYDFERMRHDGRFVRSCCKIHGGDNPNSFVISEETGLWYCHTNCGGGDVITLIRRMEECEFEEAVNKLAHILGVDIDTLEIVEKKDESTKELKAWINVMKSRKKKAIEEYIIDVPLRDVQKFRGFQLETLEHFGLKFVDEIQLEKNDGEYYTLRNRLVFPLLYEGVQIGVSLRKTKANDFPKWSHQPRSIKTSNLLYNYDATQGEPRIVIVEGPLDVWAYHEIGVVAVATFGAHITEEQYKMLMRTGADLIFSFDGDEAGRTATEKAQKMFLYKANMERVVFNEGEDPESVTREQLKLNYESRLKL